MPLSKRAKQLLFLQHYDDDDSSEEGSPTSTRRERILPVSQEQRKIGLQHGEDDPTTEGTSTGSEKDEYMTETRLKRRLESSPQRISPRIKNIFTTEEDEIPGLLIVDELYLDRVKKGNIEGVKDLFEKARKHEVYLERNIIDLSRKSALSYAIYNKDSKMLKLLLHNRVVITKSCLFHAINCNFYDALTYLLPETYIDREWMMFSKDDYFQMALTPILLAAIRNNYRILRKLYEESQDKEYDDEPYITFTEYTLDQSGEGVLETSRINEMGFEAKASPAHITLMVENDLCEKDTMKYCIELIEKIRRADHLQPNFSSSTSEKLVAKIEGYMCGLLDQIGSSEELEIVFEFQEGESFKNNLRLLDMAHKPRLKEFVTHPISQQALNRLRFKSMEFWRGRPTFWSYLAFLGCGALFPILSLLYIFFPNTTPGAVITRPVIMFACHTFSDLLFSVLLFVNTVTKNVEHDYLGSPPTVVEWFLFIWIVGKWLRIIQEMIQQNARDYFENYWHLLDILLLLLFSTCIGLRISDYAMHKDSPIRILRTYWRSGESRLWAEDLLSWTYILVFLRLLEITRDNRKLGPLQKCMTRMCGDIIRFLWIFAVVVIAFAFGLTNLYWYYGTGIGAQSFCTTNSSYGAAQCVPHKKMAFATVPLSMKTLFWALFGKFKLNTLSLPKSHHTTEDMGRFLIGIYHVISILVLLNILIAMMSKSFRIISENEMREWIYYRTRMWLPYIRQNVVLPSPMHLIPNPACLWKCGCKFIKFTKECRWNDAKANDSEQQLLIPENESTLRNKLMKDLVRRYRNKVLLEEI